jgi:alkylation response protein AidB-like acyl-CoA dehydrogenase
MPFEPRDEGISVDRLTMICDPPAVRDAIAEIEFTDVRVQTDNLIGEATASPSCRARVRFEQLRLLCATGSRKCRLTRLARWGKPSEIFGG